MISFIGGSGGKQSKKENQSQPPAEKQQLNEIIENHLIVPNEIVSITATNTIAVSTPPQKESPKHVQNKEKLNKKKKNEAILIKQLGKSHAP